MTMYRIVAAELEGMPVPMPIPRTFVIAHTHTLSFIVSAVWANGLY